MKEKDLQIYFRKIKNKIPGLDFELLISETPAFVLRFSGNSIKQNNYRKDKTIRLKIFDDKYYGISESNSTKDYSFDKLIEDSIRIFETKKFETVFHVNFNTKRKILRKENKTINFRKGFELVKNAIKYAWNNKILCYGTYEQKSNSIAIINSAGGYVSDSYFIEKFDYTLKDEGKSGWAAKIGYTISRNDIDKICKKAKSIFDLMNRNFNIVEIASPSVQNENLHSVIAGSETTKQSDLEIMNKFNSIPAGSYPVILSPYCVTELLSFLAIYAFNTSGEFEKTNCMVGKYNKKIFSKKINITDINLNKIKNFPGFFIDYEGILRRNVKMIVKGVYKNRVYDLEYAKKYKTKSTGNGLGFPNEYGPLPFNISIEKGNISYKEMIKKIKYGVFINRLHYVNLVNPDNLTLTGLTRDGFFLIEKGKIAAALKDMRINESIIELLNNIIDISKERMMEQNFIGISMSPYLYCTKIKLM